jgi:hypothetical protein
MVGQFRQDYPLSSLQYFLAKVAIVTGAIVIVLYVAFSAATSLIKATTEQLSFAKGGPAFWGKLEQKLYMLADAPDLPEEKRQKIIDALHRLALKYGPYLDALHASRPAANPGPSELQR